MDHTSKERIVASLRQTRLTFWLAHPDHGTFRVTFDDRKGVTVSGNKRRIRWSPLKAGQKPSLRMARIAIYWFLAST